VPDYRFIVTRVYIVLNDDDGENPIIIVFPREIKIIRVANRGTGRRRKKRASYKNVYYYYISSGGERFAKTRKAD